MKHITGERTPFASHLIAARKAKGLTQWRLAARAGIHVWSIEQYESGRHIPSYDSLAAICAALDVPPCSLMGIDHREVGMP